ncbi:head maturation protease, ClpP-related [Mesorhizobium sp. ISC11]|uniref:head maturation protease, ClpP-related n=1 Tax=Mesorhizobium sp. ISC11 TaxID=3076428 RepID=UPI00301D81D2
MNVLIGNELWLYGTVGEGIAEGLDGFTPLNVRDALLKVGPTADVTVRINSAGGSVTDGAAIFNILAAHRGKVTVWIEGIAASAASVVAMGGREIIIRPGAFFMIHEASAMTIGTASDHAEMIEALKTINESIVRVYADRTRQPIAEIKKWMAAETWFTADEAVAKRFADKVVDGRAKFPSHAAFDWSVYSKAPSQLVALAGSVRNTAAFEAVQARYTTARKAATDEAVTSFLRQFCLGREKEPDVASLMGTLKAESPAAYATALKLGRVAKAKGQMPNSSEIYARRNNDDIWKSAVDKANKRGGM